MRYSSIGMCVAIAWCCQACIAPVRTNYFPKRLAAEKPQERVAQPPQLEGVKTAGLQRQDTVVIDYTLPLRQQSGEKNELRESLAISNALSIEAAFDAALEDFDQGDYDNACIQFRSIIETLPTGDSLGYEARFMEAECAIVNNRLVPALSALLALSLDPGTPVPVVEKVLVRKGQVQCLLKEFESAEETFRLFRNRFPESVYLPLANCEAAQ